MSIPKFHDGALTSVALGPAKTLEIGVATVAGKRHKLVLSGLEKLRCDDFRQGNIVLDVTVYCGEDPDESALRDLFELEVSESPDYFLQEARKIRDGESTLLVIAPSYGCELLALCAKVRVEEA
jgi:hypothetical protein